MSSHFYLTLDTTPPQLEIYAPTYTTRNTLTPITIQSNETLSSYQEVYIMDSENTRHNLTFTHKDNQLIGSLYLSGYPIGIATLFVRLKDEVDNYSDLYFHSFTIIESEILTAQMEVRLMANEMIIEKLSNEFEIKIMKNEMVVVT